MDAVEFYKSMKRMCYSGEMCEKCPLYNNFSEMGSVCDVLLHITDEKASKVKSIVEQLLCVLRRGCRPGLYSKSKIAQSAPEYGVCRGGSRMTQLQEAIHNKITTYSEDE